MEFLKYYHDQLPAITAQLFKLLSFPSVASEAERMAETLACATWLEHHLRSIGFQTELLSVPQAAPAVYGHLHVSPNLPTVLLYGHYDLQPPGELSRWCSDPFVPEIRDGRLYARGARDNKGQFFFNLKAVEAAHRLGRLRYNVKVLLDGEEESASLNTLEEIPGWKERLQSDILLASETQGGTDGTPAIIMGYRGIAFMRLNLYGANRSLHSGHYGGIVRNPAVELGRLVGSMFHDDGTIAVADFLADVTPVTAEERALIKQSAFNEQAILADLAIDRFCGDPQFTPQERVAFLPAIEFPGLSGGYVGRAVRAVIPAMAQLKMTLRTARGQDGERLLACIEQHLFDRLPGGLRLEVEKRGVICPALSASVHSEAIRKARLSINELFSVEPGYLWVGATLPAIAKIIEQTEAQPLLVGFGLPEDAEHSENESFSLEQFKKGFLFTSDFLSRGYT